MKHGYFYLLFLLVRGVSPKRTEQSVYRSCWFPADIVLRKQLRPYSPPPLPPSFPTFTTRTPPVSLSFSLLVLEMQ